MSESHHHHHDCGCASHQKPAARTSRGTFDWSMLIPVLACAVCPVCLATYAKVLALAGVGVGLGIGQTEHTWLLAIALLSSLVVSAWRSVRTRRVWPILFAALGSTLVLLGHLAGDLHVVEWLGVLTLLASGLAEQFWLRRMSAPVRTLEAGSEV
jgi:hypothetical protein